MPEDVVESDAELLRAVPITLFSISGRLRDDGERLSFRGGLRNRVVFDVPVAELHSVSAMSSLGLHVWHGVDRYRFTFTTPLAGEVESGNDAVDAAAAIARVPSAVRQHRRSRDAAALWLTRLQAKAGAPPPGVRVRPPWPMWTWWAGLVGAVIVIVAFITGLVFLTA